MSKTSRNTKCPCGTGLKYKFCCLRKEPSIAAHTDPRIHNITAVELPLLNSALRGCYDAYRNSPTHPLFAQMRQLESNEKLIDFFYTLLSKWQQSPVLLNNLIVCLVELGRLAEANHFCQELLETTAGKNYNNWYLHLQISSYRSDLVALNMAMENLLNLDSPAAIKIASALATKFCARRMNEINEEIKSLLQEARLDQYCILLLSYCIESLGDYASANSLKKRPEYSLFISETSWLSKRIDVIRAKAE